MQHVQRLQLFRGIQQFGDHRRKSSFTLIQPGRSVKFNQLLRKCAAE